MIVRNLYIDFTNPGAENVLLQGTQSSPIQRTLNWVNGDVFAVRLWFRTPGALGAASVFAALDAGSVIVMAGKTSLTSATLVFAAASFAEGTSGGETYYESECSLNTAALAAAVAGSTNAVPVYVDVEVQNADNSRRLTWRFLINVTRQAYEGTEDIPATSPQAVALNSPAGGLQKCIDGVWHIKNVDTGKWHPYWLEGTGPTLMFGPGVEA
jgi:hypothetical protein